MKNNYGIALCPEEANCTLTHTQLHTLIPISLQLPSADKHTKRENDNSGGDCQGRLAIASLSTYIPYATHSLRLNAKTLLQKYREIAPLLSVANSQ
jgi:hypothetical protein